MKIFFASCVLAALMLAPASAQQYAGTWSLERATTQGVVRTDAMQLSLEYHRVTANGNESWNDSRPAALGEFRGVTMADLDRNQRKTFDIVRDAGTIHADGSFANGRGAGVWTFEPNGSLAGQLQRRSIGAPNSEQQFDLAMSDFKLSTLDALLASGFERPTLGELVSMGAHGVSDDYIRQIRTLGLRPKSVASLIRMRDHGVGPTYAATILKLMPSATIDDLVALRDHGVNERYMLALKQAGYTSDPRVAAQMRDHGVSETYIADLAKIGYHPSASDLIRLRDHGVSASFIERMRSHGYTKLSVDELIRLRDSGF